MEFTKLETEIKELMRIAFSKKVPSYAEKDATMEDVEDTLRAKFRELCEGNYGYQQNKYKILN